MDGGYLDIFSVYNISSVSTVQPVSVCTGMNNTQVLEEVTNGYRLANPADTRITCPPRVYEMMKRCWAESPQDRPSFAELRTFFNKFCAELDTPYQLDDAD